MTIKELLTITDELERFDAICLPALQSPILAETQKTEKNRITACDSQLWCVIEIEKDTVHLYPDSDSLWVKGLALLIKQEAERHTLLQLSSNPIQISEILYQHGLIDYKRRRGMAEIERRIMQEANFALHPQ